MNRMQGKTAIVTGAGGAGLGAAIARHFADEGARVVLGDIHLPGAEAVAEQLRSKGADVLALPVDLADDASMFKLVADTLQHYGALDVLVNNAAETRHSVMQHDTTVDAMNPDIWDAVFRINTRGTMLMIKHALPALIRSGSASIINISSGAALMGDLARPAYGASKAAVNALTLYVATQYGKQGVRCNAIAPGLILTERANADAAAFIPLLVRHSLTPTLGHPGDIAAMVTLLASDECRFITGQIIPIDGGLTSHFGYVPAGRDAMERASG